MPIHYERDDEHIARITIDRPEARNSADMEHFKLLREAWERFDQDDDAWVAIITGVGDAFFTGADLKKYVPEITKLQKQIAEEGLTEINGYRLDDGTRAVLRNWPLYKPVVAALNGLYHDEDTTKQLRAAVRKLREALLTIEPGAPGAPDKTAAAIAAAADILESLGKDLRTAFEKESRLSSAIFQTEDAREGPKAFAEKRAPIWQGR